MVTVSTNETERDLHKIKVFCIFFLKKEIDRFLNDDDELLKSAKTILQNVSAAPVAIFSNDHNGH